MSNRALLVSARASCFGVILPVPCSVYPVTLPVNVVSHNAYRGLPDSSNYWGYDANRENWPHISKCGVNWGNDYPGKYGWEGKRGLPTGYLENLDLRRKVEREALIKTLHYIYYM